MIFKFDAFLIEVSRIQNLSSFLSFVQKSRSEPKVSIKLFQWQFMFHFLSMKWDSNYALNFNDLYLLSNQQTLTKLRANCKFRTIKKTFLFRFHFGNYCFIWKLSVFGMIPSLCTVASFIIDRFWHFSETLF